MRRAATAAIATTILAVSVATAPLASASPAQDPALPVECPTLGLLPDPTCLVSEEVEGVLAPVTDAVGDALAPAAPVVPVAPDGGGTATPAPQPAAGPTSNAQATSSSAPVSADLGAAPALSSGASGSRGATSSRVPSVPAGSTLELGPLALPSFGLAGNPAVTGNQLATSAAVAEDLVLPAAKAAAALPDDSKATAVVFAISMLLLAGGLLLDQVRKARTPIQL